MFFVHLAYFLIILCAPLFGEEFPYEYCCEEEVCEKPRIGGNIFTLAPEYYHLTRKREGGTEQSGNLAGIRINYDHIKRYHIYWGLQGFYGGGTLKGHNQAGNKIHSRWTDEQIEGYLGYTFQTKESPYFSFTPFAGYGYMREINKFISPSPLHVKFTTHFGYVAYGFLSSIRVTPCLSAGLNVRFRTPYEPRCKVTDDPDPNVDDLNLLVGSRLQYRIELPLIYWQKFCYNRLEFGLTPFYEWREYGGRENFPFDFYRTRIRIYGVNLQIIYRF